MARVTFINPDGSRLEAEAPLGEYLLEIGQRHGIDLEGACESAMACSTCHVIVDPAFWDKLPAPSEEEEDMLDFAYGLSTTSRLACQIEITEALDGLIVRVPRGAHNMLID